MVKDNLEKIRARITAVCAKSKRCNAVTIVAAAKGRAIEEIEEAANCGIIDIGENRIQEAAVKYDSLKLRGKGPQLKWHLLGHLQTNKVKEAVRIFDLIQSVDSLRLSEEINKQSFRINKVQDILIEVKTSPEPSKSGIAPFEAEQLFKDIAKLKNINIKGLMTIAPLSADPQQARPYFKALRQLRDKIYHLPVAGYQLPFLSMGMSDDFEIAIEEGSTMVRLGRAIFA